MQFWKLDVQNEGASRAILCLKNVGKNQFGVFKLLGLPACLAALRLQPHSYTHSSQFPEQCHPLGLSPVFSPVGTTPNWTGAHPLCYSLILTLTANRPASTRGHIMRCGGLGLQHLFLRSSSPHNGDNVTVRMRETGRLGITLGCTPCKAGLTELSLVQETTNVTTWTH